MQTAKLFKNGRSQAVRLPKEFRFEGEEVYVERRGNSVLLTPKATAEEGPWKKLFEALDMFDPAHPIERHPPPEQIRESLYTMFSPRRSGPKKARSKTARSKKAK